MDLNQVTLPTTDLRRAVAFYKCLGFTLIVHSPPRYARFECRTDGPSFSLGLVEAIAKDNQAVVCFECEELDAKVAELRKAGIQFEMEPTDRRWLWREARLRDPDGNRLCLYYAGRNRLYPPWRIAADDKEEHL
jgi:catechol 2,3-dioxygenase-like lactoylglutathione lyase family enzyme